MKECSYLSNQCTCIDYAPSKYKPWCWRYREDLGHCDLVNSFISQMSHSENEEYNKGDS